MKSRRLAAVLATAALLAPASLALAGPADAAGPKTYRNCTALNKAYPHGVGKPGAVDKTSGTKVTDFTRNAKLYKANAKSDRDKDGIACEKA